MKRATATILVLILAALSAAGQGRMALPETPRPHLRYIGTEQRDGYKCHLVEYNVSRREKVKAFLLVPDSPGPHPGMVLLHDHGARFDIGKEKLVAPLSGASPVVKASSAQWVRDNFDGVWLGDRLASEGYVVIVPDMLYWGSRSSGACKRWAEAVFGEGKGDVKALRKEVYEGQRAVYDSLSRLGVNWAEKTLVEDAAAASVLRKHPKVDPERIGAAGWSMGAHRTWLLTAFCPTVKAGCALSWMTLKRLVKEPFSASEYSMYIPSLRDGHDFPDIARALLPKPFFFLSGTEDRLFPADAVGECYELMQATYREAGAEGLRTEFFEGGHHCGREVQDIIIQWFNDTL